MKVGYARVSTEDQDLDLQIDALTAGGCEKVFAEHASGSSRAKRPELAAALAFVREGDTLVITRLDRLARSVVDLLAIVEELQSRGVAFACSEQAIDTGSAAGKLQMHMLAAFAEFERSILKERQLAGIAKAKAAGKFKGRARSIDRNAVVGMLAHGAKPAHIARAMGIARGSVYRVAAEEKAACA